MSYSKLTEQPPLRAADVPYDDIAPGLYPDEIAVLLDDGTLVAVSVERHWQANGSGTAFHGYARWINEDGSTKTAPNGAHVEPSISFHADSFTLAEYGEDALATDVARLVLGEELELWRDVPEENGPPSRVPVINIPEDLRVGASIRNQVRAVRASASAFIAL